LINDLRPDLPRVESVEILNPTIEAAELTGKGIVLDVRARCVDGHQYNIEMQVQRKRDWVRFFEHWREETVMGNVTHEPVKKAMGSIRQLSADEEAQRLAEAREWGRINWNMSIVAARREGLEEGLEQGERPVLQRLLTRRFGELPGWAAERLENASAETLDTWADDIWTAGSLEELFER